MTMERNDPAGYLDRFAAAEETTTHTVADREPGAFADVWKSGAKLPFKVTIDADPMQRSRITRIDFWVPSDAVVTAGPEGNAQARTAMVTEEKVRA